MGGRVGCVFNHDQLLLGICGRRESTDAICSSVSTILHPTSSEYETLCVAAAHVLTTLASSGTQYQGTCGDVTTITSALAALNRVAMNGAIGRQRDVVGPEAMKMVWSVLMIITPSPASCACRTAYGKIAVMALRLHSISDLSFD